MYAIHIFNTTDGNLITTLETKHAGHAQKIIFSPDGKRIIAKDMTQHTKMKANVDLILIRITSLYGTLRISRIYLRKCWTTPQLRESH